ncbi:MAG: hypothetical protein R3F35_02790 [Myxococcota bacterium]
MNEDAKPTPNPSTGSTGQPSGPRRDRRGPPPNPLYHPLFLPVLLVGFWLWSGWDGFFPSEDMQEHQRFNQILFAIVTVAGLWVVPRGIKEYLAERAAAETRKAGGNSR